jgi:hypothetical protein
VSVLSQLQQENAELKAKSETKPVEPEEIPDDIRESMEYMEKEAPDIKKVIDYLIKTKVGPVETILKQIEDRMGSVETKSKASISDSYFKALDSGVTDWREINTNPEFLTWLEGTVPFTNIRKRDLLTKYASEFDAPRVLEFFSNFKNQLPSGVPSKTETSATTLDPNKFVGLPAGSSKPNVPKSTGGKSIDRGFIHAFYADLVAGRYKGREDEAKRIEEEINLAVSKGTVN